MKYSIATLIAECERIRESGDPAHAAKLLLSYVDVAKSASEQITMNCQLGLCYEHLGMHWYAEKRYKNALDHAVFANDIEGLARVKCHLMSLALASGDLEKAERYAPEIRSYLMVMHRPPQDSVWMYHQLSKLLFAMRAPREAIQRAVRLEWQAMKEMCKSEKNQMRKYGWMIGTWYHISKAWAPWSSFAAVYALALAIRSGHGLRLRQMWRKILGK